MRTAPSTASIHPLPQQYQTISVTDLNVGDFVFFHGARFQVHTAYMYLEPGFTPGPTCSGLVMVALASWIEGETQGCYFGPGIDWNFQGNYRATVRREVPALSHWNPNHFTAGQRVKHGEFTATIIRHYYEGMWEVRLPGGPSCVSGAELQA